MSVIHKLTSSIWNKEDVPDSVRSLISVPIHKKGDKTDLDNYHWLSLLSTSYKIVSNM
jgi:hypothetical protein